MGRTSREDAAAKIEEHGGPPTPIPRNLSDVGAILNRWPHVFRYDTQTGHLLCRYELDAMQNNVRQNVTYDELLKTKRSGDGNQVFFDGLRVRADRVVWLFHHGEWPPGPLKHRNGDVFDDRIENLYVPDNMRSEPGIRGRPRFRPVGVTRFYDRWRAYVRAPNGRQRVIGQFNTMEEAAAARKAWDDAHDLV